MTDEHNSDSNTEPRVPGASTHEPTVSVEKTSDVNRGNSDQQNTPETASGAERDDSLTSSPLPRARPGVKPSRPKFEDDPNATLETSLNRLLRHILESYPDTHVNALSARLGWSGQPPITLHGAGKYADITRERVRQIESRVKRDVREIVPTAVHRFLVNLPNRPQRWSTVAQQFVTDGITENPWSVKAAKALLDQVGHIGNWSFIEGERDSIVSPRSNRDVKSLASIGGVARRICRASGSVSLSYISQCLEENIPIRLLRDVILCADDIEFIDDDYVWIPSTPTKRVRIQNVARKMLAVNRPLKLAEIRHGLERKFSFRNKTGSARYKGVVPPNEILVKLFGIYPDFRVYANDIIDYNGPLTEEQELTRPEAAIVNAFKHYSANVLDRQTIKEFGDGQGINMISLEVEMTYSPIVVQVKQNVWRLVGNFANAEEIQAVSDRVHEKGFQHRLHYKGFLDNGHYRIVLRLPRFVHNFVASVPSEIGGASLDKIFYTQEQISLRCKNGAIFGFGKFLRKSGCKEGDYLTVELNLEQNKFNWYLRSFPPLVP